MAADQTQSPPFVLDLNQSPPSDPSPSNPPLDSYGRVLNYYNSHFTPAKGSAAQFPGEAGIGGANKLRKCGICEKEEVWAATVVCDGCETGFHLDCLKLGQMGPAIGADWVCGECKLSGPTQKRWVLGPVRLLDINAPPPGDGDDEMNNHDKAKSNGVFEQNSCADMIQLGNSFNRYTSNVIDHLHSSSEATPSHVNTRGFEELRFRFSRAAVALSSSEIRPEQYNEEYLLNTLSNFILEKGGNLSEGWRVELTHGYGSNPIVLYCSPNGNKFETMYEVANYLGISLEVSPVKMDERSDGHNSRHKPKSRRKRKQLARTSAKGKSTEIQNNLGIVSQEEPCSGYELVHQHHDFNGASKVANSCMKDSIKEPQNVSIHLPLQYEDFFVLCLGNIDLRDAYHSNNEIIPIGYRSIWHDRVTGSLFQCEVSDGGDCGPIFKVKRCSCSSSLVPDGQTVILTNIPRVTKFSETIESSSNGILVDEEEENILMLLSDPNSSEQELFSCLGRQDVCGPSGVYSVQTDSNSGLNDHIGEFYIEGRSSGSVWKMVAKTLLDACSKAFKQSGCLRFCCNHKEPPKGMQSMNELAKFCYASGPIGSAQIINSNFELEASFRSLTSWLEQDRFGLDIGFVQEIIETLPMSRACTKYKFLTDRSDSIASCTVGSGLLLPMQKNKDGHKEEIPYGLYRAQASSKMQDPNEDSSDTHPPPGQPLSSRLPAKLVADVLQIWEFIWRFYEVLGLKEPLAFDELEEELINPWPCDRSQLGKTECGNHQTHVTENSDLSASLYNDQGPVTFIPVESAASRQSSEIEVASQTFSKCNGVALTKAHVPLLKVLLGELQNKVVYFADPNVDAKDSRSRRGRKKDIEYPSSAKNELLIMNELTWPELARRYVLSVLSMKGRLEERERLKIFRCLHGDGGVLCGSLSGVSGMEADAMLLAEAERQISDSARQDDTVMTLECKDLDHVGISGPVAAFSDNNLPEWAQPLEPVKKLPTNVGARIRKCVYNSLDKNPPEWAKEILQHSISKEVYKGNASGPTKKAVLSILAKLTSGTLPQSPIKTQTEKETFSVSEIIMKRCRFVLRSSVSVDESKKFCNLLGTTLVTSADNYDKGMLGSPAMVSRPLDFRTIDLRLSYGAYGGSHETFLHEVREVCHNIRAAYGDQPDLMQNLNTFLHNFEDLYEKEVQQMLDFLPRLSSIEQMDSEIQKDLHTLLLDEKELPKAPWEDGVCKVCGIDKDDTSVLLCDKCDSEYHRYCLNPPLFRIPQGDWFCPACVKQLKMQNGNKYQPAPSYPTKQMGDEAHALQKQLNQLASSMEVKEYWELSLEERIYLLNFLCDEMLNSTLITEHLEQCVENCSTAQQKLSALTSELRNMKYKEESLERTTKDLEISKGNSNVGNKMMATNMSGSPLKKASAVLEYQVENGLAEGNQNFSQLLKTMIENHINGNKAQNNVMVNGIHNGNDESEVQLRLENEATNTVSNLTEFEANDVKLTAARNEIANLQVSIEKWESQIMFTSLRRDYLGRDSIGRLYWVIGRPRQRPRLVVASSSKSTCVLGSNGSNLGGKTYLGMSKSPSLVFYESHTEIKQLVSWLRDSDPGERELKENILHWQRLPLYQDKTYARVDPLPKSLISEKFLSDSCSVTKAATLLESKYGPFMKLEVNEIQKKGGIRTKVKNEERMYRCTCLEPVLPYRHHCHTCHHTFLSLEDFESHSDENCSIISANDECRENDAHPKLKRTRSGLSKGKELSDDTDRLDISKRARTDIDPHIFSFSRKTSPYDFDEIKKTFITKDPIKDIVKDIGLLGSNGVPSLISSLPLFFDPPFTLNQEKNLDSLSVKNLVASDECLQDLTDRTMRSELKKHDNNSIESNHLPETECVSRNFSSCTVPEASLRPLVGIFSPIMRQLKVNLLDIEAALLEDAWRPTKSQPTRRRAWRAFVKSAVSIFEMIQATILLENMIQSDYLKKGWWYWSSITAAVKTSTVTSLALRVYSLDDSIIYVKDTDPQSPTTLDLFSQNLRPTNKTTGKKRKNVSDAEIS